MRGGGRGTISRGTPLPPPKAAACAHQVPPIPHRQKFLSLRRFCHHPGLVECILGQHRSAGAAPPSFFFRNQSWEKPSQGSSGGVEGALLWFCDSLLASTRADLFICCSLLHVFTDRQLSSLLLRAARSEVAEGNLLVQIKIIKISKVRVRWSFWRGLRRRRNPFSGSSGPPCVAAADPGFASLGNFWVDIRIFWSTPGMGTGWQQWGRALRGHHCSQGLSFPLCNEIMTGENAFFLAFYCWKE